MDDFVIHYGADLSEVTSDLRKLERINERVAKEFGNDFVRASQVVSNSLDKISQTTVKKKIGKEFKDLQKTVIQTGTVVKLTNGQFRKYGETLTFVEGKLKRTKSSLKDVTTQVRKQQEAANKAKKANKSFAENMKFLGKRALTVIPIWLLLRSVFTGFTRLLSSSLKFLIDWEFQLAQIKIVGKDTADSIDLLSDSMLQLATSLGISNEQLGESAKLFIQQGRAAKEIIPLLDATAKLSLLTGRTTVQSVEDLTAILKAFNIDAEKSITIVDLITSVMLANAVTAADLTAAYKQVASTASVLGISLAGLTGYITAIKAETRDAGGKIGLALRTMFTRITTVSADAIQQLTGIPLFLNETGEATKIATNRFRNLETVMSELSLVYTRLGSAQKIQLAKLVAGVRRTNQAIVLFKNFNQVIKAQTDALLGLGKADKAIEILVDTTKLRIQSLNNAWKEFVNSVGDTGVIKDALDLLKNQIIGLTVLLDPRKAFLVGLQTELRDIGQNFQRNAQLAKNFTELLGLTGNLSDQLGLAETEGELDLIGDRVKIIVNQIEAFNRISPDIKIEIEPTLDAANLNEQLEAQRDKFIDIQVQAQINFDRTQLQSEFISIGHEFQKIFTDVGAGDLERLARISPDIFRQFKEIDDIVKKISKGEFITQDQINKIVIWSKQFKFTDEQVEGINRKLNTLAKTQNDLINVSGRSLSIRKEITKEIDREVAKRRSAQQVSEDLFKTEINSIKENKTKQQLLEDQLAILERQDQVLTDQLENKLKNIRKELEKIQALEEQRVLKVIINDQLERLRIAGALNSEILKRKFLLENNFKINKTESENLARQLELEREINKEKLKQNEASTETVALYKLAQKYGAKVAGNVLRILRGEATLPRRGVRIGVEGVRTREALEEFFPTVVESIKALRFFTQGLGQAIPIKEKGILPDLKQFKIFVEDGIFKQREISPAVQSIKEIQLPKVETNIDQINIELKRVFSDEQLTKQIVDALSDAIRDDDRIRRAIDERIENY